MLKRILLVLLAIFLILGCCSCNGGNSNETEPGTEKPIETEESTPADKVVLSGDTRYRIVYPKDSDPTAAKKIYNRLKALDKKAVSDDYYLLTTDEAPEDGTPEILVGLTNRKASADAKDALATYLDFSITVSENKIVIFANTDARLGDATKYFANELEKTNLGTIYYPTSKAYVESYSKYELPALKIGGVEIKQFSIIISATATDAEKTSAAELQAWLAEKIGFMIPVKTDAEAATENEIIIGKTSRPECSEFTEEYAKDVYYSNTLKGTKLLIFAGENGAISSAVSAFKAKAIELNGDVTELNESKNPAHIDNKKAIFIGNSFIYWGGCVTHIKNDAEFEELRAAGGDKGYFNEICKANGVNVDVYNYTYGGKDLEWTYENILKNKDKEFFESFDYVFISEAGQNSSSFVATFEKIAGLFPNAEEIVYLAHENTFRSNSTHIIDALPKLSAKGYKIVAWGALVSDVYNGAVKVPGATIQYNRNSFVKNSTGEMPANAYVTSLNNQGDSHHQNPLAGYITAQMCFSAITGSLCEGQAYEFCWDKTIAPQYDLENFLECQYNNGQTSNFIEIFNSPEDMKGLQILMDKYMAKYN